MVGEDSFSLKLTRKQWVRIHYALEKAWESARQQARFFASDEAQWETNTPDMDRDHALMEAANLESLMHKVANLVGGNVRVIIWDMS